MPLTDFITKWGREHTLPFDAHILNKPVFQLKIGDVPQHIPKKIAQRNQNEVHKYIYSKSLNFSRKKKKAYLHYH